LSLCLGLLNEIQYDKEEHQNQAYQGVDANLLFELTDFVEQFDPRVPFKIARSLKITNRRKEYLGIPISNNSLYSMTYYSSAFYKKMNYLY